MASASVRELEAAIDEHIRHRKEAPARFAWKAEGLASLKKINFGEHYVR